MKFIFFKNLKLILKKMNESGSFNIENDSPLNNNSIKSNNQNSNENNEENLLSNNDNYVEFNLKIQMKEYH